MNFTQAISSGFQNYFNFQGRASKSAFWFWMLFVVIYAVVGGFLCQYMCGRGGAIPPSWLTRVSKRFWACVFYRKRRPQSPAFHRKRPPPEILPLKP